MAGLIPLRSGHTDPIYLWETETLEDAIDDGEDLMFAARHAAECGQEFSLSLDLSAEIG